MSDEKGKNGQRKIVNLGAKRAFSNSDNSAWTPVEMLQQMISDIESGEIKPEQMLLIYWEPSDDGEGFFPGSLACSVSRQEELSMIEIQKRALMKNWLRGYEDEET